MGHSHVAQGTARCQCCTGQFGDRGQEPAGPGSVQPSCLGQVQVLQGHWEGMQSTGSCCGLPTANTGFPSAAQMWAEHQPYSSPCKVVGQRQPLLTPYWCEPGALFHEKWAGVVQRRIHITLVCAEMVPRGCCRLGGLHKLVPSPQSNLSSSGRPSMAITALISWGILHSSQRW